MAPAKTPNEEDTKGKDKQPPSPRRASAAKRSGNNGVATPAARKVSAAQTPKSAPAAAGAGVRKASPPKKPVEPTLLGDFLLGRPSAARQAAARRKSTDATAVRQELRQQMREQAVRRVQQPGKVQTRVNNWQKANAAAMASGNPEEAPSEPTEVAVHVDSESVTEEDRMRIKLRQKQRRKSSATPKVTQESSEELTPTGTVPKSPPKKRIVSDDNWMKRNKANISSKPAAMGPKQKLTPKDNKITNWARNVEVPESPEPPEIPKNLKPPKAYTAKCGATITVEEDDKSQTVRSNRSREFITVEEDRSSSSRTWKTESALSGDDGIRVNPGKTSSPHTSGDEKLRVKPTRKKGTGPIDDGIRVRPIKASPIPDDGIRVRPMRESPMNSISSRKTSTETAKLVPSAKRDRTPTGRSAIVVEADSEVTTPTRKSKSRVSARRTRRATAPTVTETSTSITQSDDDQSWTSEESDSQVTDRPSSAPGKSLADVPFGYSAFSELDIPVGADHHHFSRPKIQRGPSFNVVPKAFKKIMTGAKEIVQERAEPPKPVVNQPPSIENWLSGTVDPFVEKPAPRKPSLEKEWEKDVRRRSSAEVEPKQASTPIVPSASSPGDSRNQDDHVERGIQEPQVQPSVGLKRSRATRATSSPQKQTTAKIPLRETLNNLFRGESSGHKIPTKAYSAYQDTESDAESSYVDHVEQNTTGDPHVRSVEPQRRAPSPESSYVSTDVSSSTEGPYMTPAIPRRRPPPTHGHYELSTIVSEGSASTVGSETMSVLSDSTVTQATGLTRSSAISRRSKGSGLKRRLTKHSDLVSVLSLPDDDRPVRSSSIRSTSSLRRRTSNLEKVTVEDLLQEFAIDEDLYRRELKTLVDGAVPVLLKQVVHGKEDYAKDLFGAPSGGREDTLGKAVVNMGVALEKLKNLHKWAPLHDVNRILTWVLTAYPIYDKYLDVWRLGFEGIVVNLAAAPGRMDDEDSLVNAMPRNEVGDVVDTKGQPVDLQRLLTRPLARIRGLLKLMRGARAIGIHHPELEMAINDFMSLQEKARRRHREELARKTDEDASNTDTSRCCDLRTFKAMEGVLIDPGRQVNAKDFFSLDLPHSSGQRLECQVELIFRDKPKDPLDKGDVLIRDTGHSRFCLLFPPIPKTAISARRGDQPGVLVVMVRGRHNGKEWYELLTLSTDLDEQALDWLDMLGTSPVPPATAYSRVEEIVAVPSPRAEVEVPLGERTGPARLQKARADYHAPSRAVSAAEEQPKSNPPSRYHVRHTSTPSAPTTPPAAVASPRHSPSPERTPTQKSYERTRPKQQPLPVLPPEPETTPLREDMRPDPKKLTKSPPNSKPFRDDGAPPPPVHRNLSSGKPAPLTPPVELAPAARIRRRGSSPLKHEYRPSDVSSDSSETDSDSASDFDSSSDELDEADVPDTQPAISIKETSEVSLAVESVLSDENSIAPSQSASQVGLYGRLGPGGAKDPEYRIKTIASISYWSNKKGQWGEAWLEPCSIVITPGLIEAYPLSMHAAPASGALNSSGSSESGGDADLSNTQPLIALELTPIVMIRQSTVIDVEIRSPVRPYCKLANIDGKIFRFRAQSAVEGSTMYMAVHKARLNNAKYKALAEEARFSSFGQQQQTASQESEEQSSSSHRRSWFGRKNSYRASTRAPSQSVSQSQGTSSSISAPSLLKRLTGGGSTSFNIDKSSVDRRSISRPPTAAASLYTSGSSSSGNVTPPRSPSISLTEASGHTVVLGSDNLKVRCHLLVTPTKWEDYGNCTLKITRPPPGMRQELRIRHGMEKRVIVTKIPKKTFGFGGGGGSDKDNPVIVLDVVLGSKCFGRLGTRGIILNVWEDVRDEQNNVGLAPKTGGLSGTVKKWCFQCSSAQEANWIFGLVAQEVNIAL